ncbi:MAG: serine/threonine protein kinase [Gemmatales bacterium]|nr:serine/threonine protein kinase [Gemmatales bacterium]MDW8387410.1 serine/threonine-protein kinase [Gemmatales bacterium]
MDCCDAFLLGILADNSPISPAETISLTHWWHANRRGDEGLTDFLTRHEVLIPDAPRLLHFMRHGYVTFTGAGHLFTSKGAEKARRHLQSLTESIGDGRARDVPGCGPAVECFTVTEHKVIEPVRTAPERPTGDPSQHRSRRIEAGQVLGKCLLLDEIGRGGSSIVFRGFHQGLQVPVAVKVLLVEGNEIPPSSLFQLQHEARLLARLKHPHIVGVLDFDSEADVPYLVLEYVDGISLSELIRHSGRLCWDRALRVGLQIAEALAAAHRLGIIHRDIKPANILIHREGHAKLADLGLAVVRADEPLPDHRRTSLGVAGTVAYMAPEQATGSAEVDHRSDIYALGATLYHAVTGQVPFLGRTRAEVLRKHAEEPLPSPEGIVPGLNPSLSRVLCRMLAKRPEERFSSYDELIACFTSLLKSFTPGSASTDLSSHPAPRPVDPPPPSFAAVPRWWREWSARLDRWLRLGRGRDGP